MSDVGRRIKEERETQNYSQNALAKRAGIAQATLNAIEASTKNPSVETVLLVAKALGVKVSYLLGETEDDKTASTPEELRLLAIVQRLNPLGVQKVIEYASDLSENEKYTQDTSGAASAV